MEPLGALGLACNIVQLIQFVSTILSTTEEIYQSAEGSSTENLTLNNVAQNLRDLSSVLPRAGRPNAAGDKRSDAEKQLQMLCDEIDIVTNQILKYLDSLKSEQPHDRWASFRHALGCVVSQKEIRALEKRLAGVRVQFDTTLLICIRYVPAET